MIALWICFILFSLILVSSFLLICLVVFFLYFSTEYQRLNLKNCRHNLKLRIMLSSSKEASLFFWLAMILGTLTTSNNLNPKKFKIIWTWNVVLVRESVFLVQYYLLYHQRVWIFTKTFLFVKPWVVVLGLSPLGLLKALLNSQSYSHCFWSWQSSWEKLLKCLLLSPYQITW